MRRSEFRMRPLLVLMLVGLAGCASQKKTLPGDDEPTLASLASRWVVAMRSNSAAAGPQRRCSR